MIEASDNRMAHTQLRVVGKSEVGRALINDGLPVPDHGDGDLTRRRRNLQLGHTRTDVEGLLRATEFQGHTSISRGEHRSPQEVLRHVD